MYCKGKRKNECAHFQGCQTNGRFFLFLCEKSLKMPKNNKKVKMGKKSVSTSFRVHAAPKSWAKYTTIPSVNFSTICFLLYLFLFCCSSILVSLSLSHTHTYISLPSLQYAGPQKTCKHI